ncbi:sialate O-acetylesterase [Sphingomonas sp. LB3N6]|uniref:sialate O-acetylesterase n=1 Tax=Sphingomonas fucosidasi TaxID=3096164 RepID=UPI002FCC4D25
MKIRPSNALSVAMVGIAVSLGSAVSGSAAAADPNIAPRLDGIIGDHAVLQRGQPVVLRGQSLPGRPVTVRLAGRTSTVKADRDGRFELRLKPLSAGGPYDLTVTGSDGVTTIHDLLIGDVFLCSGQSNMELAVNSAQDLIPDAHPPLDDQLRLVTIAKATSETPLARFAAKPQWAAADPDTVPGFSAACFYMVQALRRSERVPIGAIHASWGGSRISAWMSDTALRSAGMAREADLLAVHAKDAVAAERGASTIWEEWWRGGTGDAKGREPWQPDAVLDWKPVPKIGNFENWGVPALADYNGMVWYQRVVTLTTAQARGAATLAIGVVDDADRTWVNGIGVGGNSNAGRPRIYTLPAGALKAGRNVITVNDDDVYAYGGMTGPADTMTLTLADGSVVPIGDGWRYAIARRVPGNAPRSPWDDINGAGTLYNGMIAPLGPTALAGIAWYQGESDTGLPGYETRLATMTRAWRQQFGRPTIPLAIAQLANYGTPPIAPGESGWANVREAQRVMAQRDGHAGVAVTIDLGDPLDIHPGEKHAVGQRLARVIRPLAYAGREPVGPGIASASRTPDGGVTLRFTGVTGALHARASAQAIGFELCGADAGSCRYASAVARGDRVTLAPDGKPVVRVRYAWADSPVVNLADEAQLPVGPFEIPLS